MAGVVGNGDGCAVGKPVGRTDHKIFKAELGIEVHGGFLLAVGLVGSQFFVTKDYQLGIGVEDLLQRVLNVAGAAAADIFPAEIRGRIEDQMLFIELHNLRVIEPGGHGNSAQTLFHMQ